MTKVKIVTDSTGDLSHEMIEKYDINVIPLTIVIDDESYLDRVDIEPEEFIKKMKEAVELPKSSQPPAGKFAQVYDELGADGSSIISIHMTGGMSGTVRSAESAAGMTDADVTVIDSMFISRALAFQVIEAAKMAQAGASKQEILERIEHIRKNSQLFVTVDTLENLVKGGRIGRGKAMIGSLLNIKPIASLADGVYTPVTKVRSHSQIVKFLAKQFAEDVKNKTVKAVGIAHADSLALATNLKNTLLEMNADYPIDICYTTPVISTHTGPGAIGFMYFAE
ncbi:MULTISPECIES: DegV family protein [Metabacillus]|uniref:DegV family protein n=1 Tax=Metabacillus hrfriensis TaxID=3048891 RepID=A0ACD4R6T7_9BACI|nr:MULTISPECIES: DegV family protein [Metabacillus]UAL50698.1 DegV family protein [Metabacillus dongyingensis]USK26966.1 DegV family protein [Bacillus sp. CMF21]WHZ56190.1 DegV family protein [Metabacillus sp. CT-WN-B3]